MINNLNNGKAAGIDKIIPELVKALDDNTLEIIVLVLNCILDSGVFPEEWSLGVVVMLHKEGERSDLNNFRGITLLRVLGKLLVGVMNNRLTSFLKKNEILLENQCGFRKGYQTTDHIFALSALIDHYVNKNQKKLFLCFVDFRKAFNKVDHCLLWTKLLNYGIDGKFMRLIRSMYNKMKSCVRYKFGVTKFFKLRKGVRQGCLLSPLLFALFLNDLDDFLKVNGANGIDLWDVHIFSLLYADDLILIATNEHDLKLQMHLLGQYAEKCKMEINAKKTKVMVFNDKSWKNAGKYFGCIGSNKLYTTDFYKYLGVTFDNKMSFHKHVSTITEKANKCLWALKTGNGKVFSRAFFCIYLIY